MISSFFNLFVIFSNVVTVSHAWSDINFSGCTLKSSLEPFLLLWLAVDHQDLSLNPSSPINNEAKVNKICRLLYFTAVAVAVNPALVVAIAPVVAVAAAAISPVAAALAASVLFTIIVILMVL